MGLKHIQAFTQHFVWYQKSVLAQCNLLNMLNLSHIGTQCLSHNLEDFHVNKNLLSHYLWLYEVTQ